MELPGRLQGATKRSCPPPDGGTVWVLVGCDYAPNGTQSSLMPAGARDIKQMGDSCYENQLSHQEKRLSGHAHSILYQAIQITDLAFVLA